MASTSATLSWTSTSWLNTHNSTKFTNRTTTGGSVFVVVAQKKARKIRKVFGARAGIVKVTNFAGRREYQIILKEDVTDLGKKGQLLEVKRGYFRNYLLPMGKAQIVTPRLIKEMRMEEERIEAEKRRVKEEAEQLAIIFQTVGAFKLKRKTGKGKQIFGSVTSQDLVDIIKVQLQRDVDKTMVTLPEIKETGEYVAELQLHPEVTAQVRLNVYGN